MSEPDQVARAEAAMQAMAGYFVRLSDAKRAEPADDLMTVLSAAFDRGDLTRTALADLGLLLLTGGHETTTSLINNTLRGLPVQEVRRLTATAVQLRLPRRPGHAGGTCPASTSPSRCPSAGASCAAATR